MRQSLQFQGAAEIGVDRERDGRGGTEEAEVTTLEARMTISSDPLSCATMVSEIVTDGCSDRAELHFDSPVEALKSAAMLMYFWADTLACPERAGEEA
jgi:hypothetical protein